MLIFLIARVPYLCAVKKGIFIIVVLLLVKPVLPVLEYVLNYNYIAAELCENRAKPEMKCNGKCHLMKQLAKASEGEKPESQKKQLHSETEVLFCNAFPDFSFRQFNNSVNSAADTYSNLYNHSAASPCFHPPSVI